MNSWFGEYTTEARFSSTVDRSRTGRQAYVPALAARRGGTVWLVAGLGGGAGAPGHHRASKRVAPYFADGWKGIPIKAPGAKGKGAGWPIEQSAYWLDGALRLGLVLHDQSLISKIRIRLDALVKV